jgi:FG-GAP repeat protein/VCBS repeat protein
MPRNVLQSLNAGVLVLGITLMAGTAAAQNVSVTAADPNTGEQGTLSLVVKISGKNFAPGARSDFFLSGTTNPAGITVHGTQWVSSTEVDATIDIADAASLALFDIRVTNTSGRSGKGSDLFQVVQKGGGANQCVFTPLDTTRFQLVRSLNQAVNGQPLYQGDFGTGLAARRTTLTYATGARDVILLAVGARTGTLDVFFVDPATGAVLDGTAIVPGGPVQPHITIVTNVGTHMLDIGDVNDDGVPDIVSAQYIGQGSAVRLSVGQRSASGVISYTLVTVPPPTQSSAFGYDVAMGDLDGDGFDEILVTKGAGGKGNKVENAALFVYAAPAGVPSLVQTIVPPQNGYGTSVSVGDLNGDGRPDVAVGAPGWVNGGISVGAVLVHLSTGTRPAMLQTTPIVLLSPAPFGGEGFGARVKVGDAVYDAAHQMDLVALDDFGNGNPTGDVFQGPIAASGQPSTPALHLAPESGRDGGWATKAPAVSDLNSDGLPDVVVGSPNADPPGCSGNIGVTYVYLAQGSIATGTTGWTRYRIDPPSPDGDALLFGWSTVSAPGSSLLFVGEHARNVGGVTAAGQVYIYKVLP